jgi:phage/plasmid-associated DNA primase
MVPESVVAASEQYFVNEDDIEQWLDDCVDRSDPRAFTTTRVLYTSRKIWCEARGLSPGTEKAFSEELADNKGFEWERRKTGRGFVGVNSMPTTSAHRGAVEANRRMTTMAMTCLLLLCRVPTAAGQMAPSIK